MTPDATGENASFGLVGSQRGWANAGPGRLTGLMLMRQLSPLITAAITTALTEASEAGHQIHIRTVKRLLELGSDQQGRPMLH